MASHVIGRSGRCLIHATQADVTTIVDLHRLAHVVGTMGAPTREQVTSGLDDPNTTTYLIERDHRVVGFALVTVFEGWLGEIRRLIAAEPGHGDGTFAMNSILKRFFETDGLHRAYLEVRASNTIARRLTNDHTSFLRERGAKGSAIATGRSTISVRMVYCIQNTVAMMPRSGTKLATRSRAGRVFLLRS